MGGLVVRVASDMLTDPEVMSPPRSIVPVTAFAGRVTLLVGPKKCGKSTFLTTAIAAVTSGRILFGEAVAPPTVLWAALDEAEGDLVRRLHSTGADLSKVFIVSPPARSSQILAAARLFAADVLVIDTISDLAHTEIDNENDNLRVKAMLAPFRLHARSAGAAIVLLHHTAKSSGYSRGAGAFEDTADHIMTLSANAEDPTVRNVEVRGRLAVEDFKFRWTDTGLELPQGEASTLSVVRAYVWAHPGCRSGEIYTGAGRQRDQVRQAIAKLAAAGEIVNRGNPRLAAWFVPGHGNDVRTRRPDELEAAQEMDGNDPETTSETPVVTAPPKGGVRETTQRRRSESTDAGRWDTAEERSSDREVRSPVEQYLMPGAASSGASLGLGR